MENKDFGTALKIYENVKPDANGIFSKLEKQSENLMVSSPFQSVFSSFPSPRFNF